MLYHNLLLTVSLQDEHQQKSVTGYGRRLLQTVNTPTSLYNNEVTNPLICLEIDEMIIFRIWVDDTDRKKSNYPVYVKDHLYNSNPTFDFGDFSQLEYYVTQTNVTYNSFGYAFTEAGSYVFADSQEPDRYSVLFTLSLYIILLISFKSVK